MPMSVNWAFQRQLFYLGVLALFFLITGLLIVYPAFNKSPTCTDGKQNGSETGVDCGGSCRLACVAEVDPISILWSRSFRVIPGRYNALAYLENKNERAIISKINYRFRFADKDNVFIGKREGSTYVPPAGRFAIFEPAIDVGNSIPVYTTFEFTEAPAWEQAPQGKIDQLKVLVSNISLEAEKTFPRLSATIKNNSLFTIPDLSVVAILYDETGNAVGASRTYLAKLSGEESAVVNFTWPEPIPGTVVAREIIPMFNIFAAELR